jgi:hypothetical protein
MVKMGSLTIKKWEKLDGLIIENGNECRLKHQETGQNCSSIPKDPWCWNIYQPVGIIWTITLGVNVGKYSSTMDPLGMIINRDLSNE